MSAVSKYTQTQTLTSSPERVLALLMQCAEKHLRLAIDAFERDEPRAADVSLRKVADIVWELINTLDSSRAPDLAKNLTDVYGFVHQRLVRAMLTKDVEAVREAERVFHPVAAAFVEAVDQVLAGAS